MTAKILIVDDKPENLIALEKVLDKTQAEVYQATSGNEALKLLMKHQFALAISTCKCLRWTASNWQC